MQTELTLNDFIENIIATPAEWRKYQVWGNNSLFDDGYWQDHKDPALNRFVDSQPSPDWYEREKIYAKWNDKIVDVLRSRQWDVLSKASGSNAFTVIEITVASKLHMELHKNRFTVDGRTYNPIVFRQSTQTTNSEKLKHFIEVVCNTLSPENIVKNDVRALARALLDFSFTDGLFNNLWKTADIPEGYRKAGPRAGKLPSRN